MISTEEKTTFTIPEGVELIDDAFYVTETRFMWKSVLKDGKDFLFGLDKKVYCRCLVGISNVFRRELLKTILELLTMAK